MSCDMSFGFYLWGLIVYKKVKSKPLSSIYTVLMSSAGEKRPSDVLPEATHEGGTSISPKKKAKGTPKKHKPLPESKFGGMTEEEVCKLLLPDHMKPGLDIIFVRGRL